MDNIESIAQRFLLSRGFRQIIYEPDGNVPPDFLVDGSIAIEVRKLNKQLAQLGNEPLEHAAAELYLGLNNVYRSMGLSVDHESWFVFHRFSRPLPRWKMLKKNVIEILTALSQMSIPDSAEMLVDNNLLLRFARANKPLGDRFVFGGYSDLDASGFVVADVLYNLKLCIEQKTRKVAPHRPKYEKWWLLLVDFIGHGLDAVDIAQLRQCIDFEHSWDKVLVVSPETPERFFEL